MYLQPNLDHNCVVSISSYILFLVIYNHLYCRLILDVIVNYNYSPPEHPPVRMVEGRGLGLAAHMLCYFSLHCSMCHAQDLELLLNISLAYPDV